MWMLIAVMCLDLGADIECRRYARPPEVEGAVCGALRQPLRDYLMAQADQLGAPVVKLTIEYRRGRDG